MKKPLRGTARKRWADRTLEEASIRARDIMSYCIPATLMAYQGVHRHWPITEYAQHAWAAAKVLSAAVALVGEVEDEH